MSHFVGLVTTICQDLGDLDIISSSSYVREFNGLSSISFCRSNSTNNISKDINIRNNNSENEYYYQ